MIAAAAALVSLSGLTGLMFATGGAPGEQVVGRSDQGREIRVEVLGEGDDTVLIIGTIHGDEAAGTPLMERLSGYLKAHPHERVGRRVVLMPVANPDGWVDQTRTNARGVDLNRNFPAPNWSSHALHGAGPLSEPESRAILEAIETWKPSRIITIHQPLRAIDYDGPAKGLARAMARHCPLSVRRIGGRTGSLGSWASSTMGVPVITLELPSRASREDASKLWKVYGEALLAAIQFTEPAGGSGTKLAGGRR